MAANEPGCLSYQVRMGLREAHSSAACACMPRVRMRAHAGTNVHTLCGNTRAPAPQFSQLEGDPDSFLIFERFITKEYLETVHWTSEEFKTFGQKMREADL